MRRCALAAAISLALAPALAHAQSPDAPATPYQQTLSIDPILLPFGVFSAEYERALSGGLTFGVGGTYAQDLYGDTDDDTARDTWAEGKLMYYPGEVPLRGFSIGLTVGFHSARNDGGGLFDPGGATRTESAPTAGVLLDYNWLIGRRHRFLVGAGIGARRVLENVPSDSPLSQVYPDARLQIGLAF